MVEFPRVVMVDFPAGFYNNIITLCHEIQGAQWGFCEFFVFWLPFIGIGEVKL